MLEEEMLNQTKTIYMSEEKFLPNFKDFVIIETDEYKMTGGVSK